jgi:hypothetical protein
VSPTRLTTMPLTYTSGDPFLTKQQTLGVGYNARARTETSPLAMELLRRYPTAFAACNKQIERGRLKTGDLWLWRESAPVLAFMIVRESSVGATRPRYVDAVALRIVRDYQLEGITNLAIAPLGRVEEQPAIREALDLLLPNCPLPVIAYERYLPGVQSE